MAGAHSVEPAAARSSRWKHAIAGLATVAAIALIAITRCTPDGPPAAPSAEAPALDPTIAITAPPLRDEADAAAWKVIADHVRHRRYGQARAALAAWERERGPSDATRALRAQLDARAPSRPPVR